MGFYYVEYIDQAGNTRRGRAYKTFSEAQNGQWNDSLAESGWTPRRIVTPTDLHFEELRRQATAEADDTKPKDFT